LHEAARTLRLVIALRDPRRRLQWNRITIFVTHPMVVEPSLIESLSKQLYPATRHLGLERVAIRLRVLDSEESSEARDVEVVVSDRTGNRMEIEWREPHTAPLVPAATYERSVVAARVRGLIYPYEIIRMLAPKSGESLNPLTGETYAIPPGMFEEYDLDPSSAVPRAVSVLGREPGKNSSAIVFGLITTPTKKVP